jgi:hypothetical protein
MYKELEIIVDDLKKYLAKKELELRENSNFTLYTEGSLLNRHREIENFQHACKNCSNDFTQKQLIITNFKNDADKIKLEIDKITC